ncbi:MAG: phosphotransferase, partial [Planctomycetota bacterium]|nr:phosphotransferase [Planctomycetota bacterium]
FQVRLAGLDAKELRTTIPDFFDSEARLRQLDVAAAADANGRRDSVEAELAFVGERRATCSVMEEALRSGRMPARVVHGDTKLNNVLFDRASGEPRCVVDLDTCMPGYSLYDFGDLVRFTAATCDEDERDLDLARIDGDTFRALEAGYLEHAAAFLTPFERDHMAFSARLVTLTIGMRFLADHLAGDRYFKISRSGQNLDRARVQFALVADMERRLGGGA